MAAKSANAANVVFENVSKVFGNFTAVDSVSFTVEAGTLVTLLGPSGCGKTTTLRMICLLYTSPSPRDRTRSRMPSSA